MTGTSDTHFDLHICNPTFLDTTIENSLASEAIFCCGVQYFVIIITQINENIYYNRENIRADSEGDAK